MSEIRYQQILLRKPIRHKGPIDDNLVDALTSESMERIATLPDMESLCDEGWEISAVSSTAN